LHQGVGPSRARTLLDTLKPGDGDVEERHAEVVAAAPSVVRTSLAATLHGLSSARGQAAIADRADGVLQLLRPLLTARYADHTARLGDLDRLVGAAAKSPTLAEYVASLTLDPPASTGDLAGPPHLDDDYLVLSTVHSAKGLEWPVVHVIHLVDGAFPSDMALTSSAGLIEEQRLFYVAVTRAADELSLYAPLRMPHHRHARDDKHSFAPVSRFLDDDAMAALDVEQLSPPRPTPQRIGVPARVALPTLDDLWA
jgi:DNA helicase-2/ATP-dependent DNA helicase PcrA